MLFPSILQSLALGLFGKFAQLRPFGWRTHAKNVSEETAWVTRKVAPRLATTMPSHPSPNSAALFARLPPYLLSHVLEFGTDQDFTCLFRFGEVSRAFLEALAFVEVLHVDPLHLVRNGTEPIEYDNLFISHRYDTRVKRWCGLARARFKNVKRMHDGGGWGKTYNAAQTREIIDCAASFPHLTKLDLVDTEPAAACASIAAHMRAGRFTRLDPDEFRSGVRLADLRGIAEELSERLRVTGCNVPDVDAARMQCGPVCRELLADGILNVGAVLRIMANRWGCVRENRQ